LFRRAGGHGFLDATLAAAQLGMLLAEGRNAVAAAHRCRQPAPTDLARATKTWSIFR